MRAEKSFFCELECEVGHMKCLYVRLHACVCSRVHACVRICVLVNNCSHLLYHTVQRQRESLFQGCYLDLQTAWTSTKHFLHHHNPTSCLFISAKANNLCMGHQRLAVREIKIELNAYSLLSLFSSLQGSVRPDQSGNAVCYEYA